MHARYPNDLAASRDSKYTLLCGIVRLPGGQFGRQYIRVVLQAFINDMFYLNGELLVTQSLTPLSFRDEHTPTTSMLPSGITVLGIGDWLRRCRAPVSGLERSCGLWFS